MPESDFESHQAPSQATAKPHAGRQAVPLLFLARTMVFGLATGVALAAALILTNAGGLNDLIAGDQHPYLMTFLFEFLFGLTFASLSMGIAIMTLGAKPDRHDAN